MDINSFYTYEPPAHGATVISVTMDEFMVVAPLIIQLKMFHKILRDKKIETSRKKDQILRFSVSYVKDRSSNIPQPPRSQASIDK